MDSLSDGVPFVVEKEGSTPLKPREIGGKELFGDVITLRGLLRARQRLHTVGADTLFPIVNHPPAYRAAAREEELEDTMEKGEGQVVSGQWLVVSVRVRGCLHACVVVVVYVVVVVTKKDK